MVNIYKKKYSTKYSNQKGFVIFFTTILVLIIVSSIALSISFLTFGQQKISANILQSTQSYYLAETGVEDALLRLKNNPQMPALFYNIILGGKTADINISDIIGGSRTVTSGGNVSNRIKIVQVVYEIDIDGISFFYGAQVDNGGIEMGNNSKIKGNVFSNGSVIGGNGATIQDSIIVANNGNKISGLDVGRDALVYTCEDSQISGSLTYVLGGTSNCSVGGSIQIQSDAIEPENLPITQSQIDEWKDETLASGIINNNVVLDGVSSSLGPVQIGTIAEPKNLTITNNSIIKIIGTVYVTGNIIFSNNSIAELDVNYGSNSGVIIADGRITVDNNAVLRGSGQAGSYILILSTNNSLVEGSPAISVNNNAEGAIFYATSGLIHLSNGMIAREITGYKLKINNTAQIQYESGLANAKFSSGPGGGWKVKDWKEIE